MIIVYRNTKLINPFGEAEASPLFFVLLNDPSELVAFLLRPWSVAERAEEEGLHFYLESII